ncbi:hypothetical protein JCM10296v2_000883 [Rhodotorula toruloides]
MHPNSPAALFGSFSLPSPIPDDFATRADIQDFAEPSESTWKQRLRAKDSPDCAVFDPALLPAFFSSFCAFLKSWTDAAFSSDEMAGELPVVIRSDAKYYSREFDQLHWSILRASARTLDYLISSFIEVLDPHLPESVRAGPDTRSGRNNLYRGDLDGDGDVINLDTKPAFILRRSHVPSVVVMVQHRRASSDPHGILNRLIEAFRSSQVQRVDAELKKRDSHRYSLLLRVVVSCRSRSCDTFVLFDYLHYLIGFLVPLDPSSPTSVFSALARCDSRETPVVQVAAALLYADRFFGDELRRRADSIVEEAGLPEPPLERAKEKEKRNNKAGDGGPATRTRQKLAEARTPAPLEKIQRFRLIYPDGTPAEYTPFVRFDSLGNHVSTVASEATEDAVATLEMDDYLGHGATSNVFRAYWPSSPSADLAYPSSSNSPGPLPTRKKCDFVPKLYGAFKARLAGTEDKEVVVLIQEDCGEPIERWSDLTDDEIDKLLKDLTRLHVEHHISHDDLTTEYSYPRNIVVSPASPGSGTTVRRIRVIDFCWAQEDHECEGEEKCGELRFVRKEIGVSKGEDW